MEEIGSGEDCDGGMCRRRRPLPRFGEAAQQVSLIGVCPLLGEGMWGNGLTWGDTRGWSRKPPVPE